MQYKSLSQLFFSGLLCYNILEMGISFSQLFDVFYGKKKMKIAIEGLDGS
jgi:hypothetical protein